MKKIITHLLALTLLSGFIFSPVSAAVLSEPVPTSAKSSEPSDEKITEAFKAFNNLSKKEKKERMRTAKHAIKQMKADKKSGKLAESDTDTVLLVILAILLPPLAVYLHEDEINTKFWLSIIFTLLFWIPGVIYALLVVLDVL
jgi:uncharacterized membrane protein YqaE (UPF0057 family)